MSSVPPVCDLFLDRALANHQTLDKNDSRSLIIGCLLLVNYALTEDLVEGIKIIDLPANSVKVLKHLAQLTKVDSAQVH